MQFSEIPHIVGYTMEYPCAAIHDINYYIRSEHYGKNRHVHDMYQYLIVTDGVVTLEYNGMTYMLTRGWVSLIPPHVPHVIYTEKGYAQLGFNFCTDYDLAGVMQLVEKYIKQPVVIKDSRFLENEKEMIQLIKTYSIVKQAKLNLRVGEALLHVVESIMYGNDDHFDIQLSFFLQQHLDEKLTTTQIAEQFHMSVAQLERLSHRYFQCGAMALFSQKRLAHARVLLNTTDKSISEIAQETGFYDASHFSSFFRKQVGMSPSKWRKENGWGLYPK